MERNAREVERLMNYLEKEILGCFLKDNTLLQETNLSINHFEESHHKKLFKTMAKLSEQNKAIDHVSLMTEQPELIADLGGPEYILDIETKGNPEHYDTYERDLITVYKQNTTDQIVKDWLSKEERGSRELLDEVEKINDEGETKEVDINGLLADMIDEVNKPKSSLITGVPSGLEKLDMLTSGWQSQTSTIMGARPSMGKTALMLKFMLSAAKNGDVPVVFSLEMSAKSLLRRLTTAIGQINGFEARNPQNMQESKQKRWMDAVGEISNLDFEIYDNSFQTIQYIRSKVRKAQKKYKGKRILVLIDYLTLIENTGKFTSDHAKVTDTSKKLKAIAKDYDVPVITLAQLSRQVEQRQDKRPMKSDLRESGSIEQDADLILLLYRDSYYNAESENPNDLEIDLSKQREGATGQITVNYNRSTGVITD
ncbi:replicative DNA helicase [Virgibacillus salexigens]|uniref:DNA 5'-3' helicase n=2 Tax=Virgibacillus massiliensis TaxID=1462526 RepID=A0A024QBA2_9BACI|nr:DnaB-like helicase C-terminal domain-containing protein [Virgibacillus massiliensis]CDQ39517.1 Replicative DNA helicase [Virgibacillus massiliensis]